MEVSTEMEEKENIKEQNEHLESVNKPRTDLDEESAQLFNALVTKLHKKVREKTSELQTSAERDYATKQIFKAERAETKKWMTIYNLYLKELGEQLSQYGEKSEYGLPVSIERDRGCRKALIRNTSFAVVYKAMLDDVKSKMETIEIVKEEKKKGKDVDKWFYKFKDEEGEEKSRYFAVVTPDRKTIATKNDISERTVKSTIKRMCEEGYLIRIGKTEPRGPTFYAIGYWSAWLNRQKSEWKPIIVIFIKADDRDRLRSWKLKSRSATCTSTIL